jgi:N-acetylglucosamine-6-phosphate deacetylase
MSRLVIQGTAMIDREIQKDQILICDNGKFTYAGPAANAGPHLSKHETPDLIVEQGMIIPGLVDIHVHGSLGYDVMDGTEEALRQISRSLASYGVTAFLATTLTAGVEELVSVLETCRRHAEGTGIETAGAELIGVHLEGPWINRRYKGAQNEQHVTAPSLDDARRLLQAGGDLLKIVTLAPESENAEQVVEFLTQQGVTVSVGHSDASYEQVKQVVLRGSRHVTHCFNAMRGLHHREPGVVGAALHHEELTAELIADGIHVHPVVMSILHRVKTTDRLVLVSDGMRAVGLTDGEYDLGGLSVQVADGEARLHDGTLAGSTLTLDRAIRNMVDLCQIRVSDAVTMASDIPAVVAGVGHRKGRIAVGCDADFVWMDEGLNVVRTYRGGQLVYARTDSFRL